MCRCTSFIVPAVLTVAGVAAVAGSIAFAQPGGEKKPTTIAPKTVTPAGHGAQPEVKLPPGMSMEDMQACMAAATPGEMHKFLAKSVGTWSAQTKMWMAPGMEPNLSGGTYTVTPLMDGRFIHGEMKGDMGEMGPFHGMGLNGYDNVTQKFVGTWIDNWGTGIMTGTGDLAKDGKTINWTYTMNCPMTKKEQTLREIYTFNGPNEMTLEMFGPDRATGKEFKHMEIKFTRTGNAPTATAPAGH